MIVFLKDPDATLDYNINWADWLVDGDTITTSTIIADAAQITVDSDTHTSTSVTVWLSGGTAGETVTVTSRITTAEGRTDDRTMTLLIRQR